jgi:hypothetical protein
MTRSYVYDLRFKVGNSYRYLLYCTYVLMYQVYARYISWDYLFTLYSYHNIQMYDVCSLFSVLLTYGTLYEP